MQIKDLEVFSAMPFLFWVKNVDGRHLFGNKVICDLVGIDEQRAPVASGLERGICST